MILHLTTVHPRNDVRIFLKEVESLNAGLDLEVALMVADGLGDEKLSRGLKSISVIDIGKPRFGRVGRLTVASFRVLVRILRLKPSIVHFHDPELLLIGIILRLLGLIVIYDIHEDVPRQILSKHWIPLRTRRIVSMITEAIEWVASLTLSAFVAATPTIAKRFPNGRTICLQNYVLLSEIKSVRENAYHDRKNKFGYVGVISKPRGIEEIVSALEIVNLESDLHLSLAGYFSPDKLRSSVANSEGWKYVSFHGFASRAEVMEILCTSRAGLLLLHPLANHVDSQPVKMFEYMAAGIPIIASDFPLWREIISGVGCGILVDPLDVEAIAAAMKWVLDNPSLAEEMGNRGRVAAQSKYNWDHESDKLLELYRSLLSEESK